MSLSKKRNRERMRIIRLHKHQPPPQVIRPVQPIIDAVSPSVRREGYGKASSTVQPIPLYNPTIHRAGDTVLIQQGKRQVVTTIPELDADGQSITNY